eukprot:scaffold134441_cov69-Attheya_sp.AAC.2
MFQQKQGVSEITILEWFFKVFEKDDFIKHNDKLIVCNCQNVHEQSTLDYIRLEEELVKIQKDFAMLSTRRNAAKAASTKEAYMNKSPQDLAVRNVYSSISEQQSHPK